MSTLVEPTYYLLAKGLVVELATFHAESAWEFRRKRVRTTGLVACCNYFSKKKKKNLLFALEYINLETKTPLSHSSQWVDGVVWCGVVPAHHTILSVRLYVFGF